MNENEYVYDAMTTLSGHTTQVFNIFRFVLWCSYTIYYIITRNMWQFWQSHI
jgi:hypothetical protein